MNLKEKMQKGPVFGVTVYTGAICAIETIGNWGFDFVYLDIEHTPLRIGTEMERQIMAARLSGVSPLVRLASADEVEIRKALELGAEGVVIPHIRTKEEAELCVRAAKFPPLGRRGAESNVRAARFGGPGFKWADYIAQSNADTMVIPMCEDFEFIDNLDEILAVPGIDAVNFGPVDYSLSINEPVGYQMSDKVTAAYEKLVKAAQPRGIGIMGPVVPPTLENVNEYVANGMNMIIMGNDMWHFQNACKKMVTECIEPFHNRQ
jgi:4-hydroxy-2-oxoheptanedioate aldolase